MTIPPAQTKCSQECPAQSLPPAEADALLRQLGNGWTLSSAGKLEKEFRFPDFRQALGFVNLIGAAADEQNHHPDIALAWGRVQVQLWTHRAGGLTGSDFILAAKIDSLPRPVREPGA